MRTRALLLALTLALAGCQPPAGAPPVTSGDPQLILGQNALISNNTASLSGTVMGPATLISNAGASYRIQAAAEMGPVKQAMVYLTTPDERFYAGADGKALFAMTDDEGRYAFAKAPGEEPVVVTVLLANNRRLVGFLIPAKGENTYHVNLATTVIAEFLRDHARLAHKTMADFPKFHEKLPQIMTMTQELIDAGKLVVEDISMTSIPEMRHAYVRAFGKDYKELSDAWEEVLGYRPYLIEDYEVGVSAGMRAIAVTTLGSELYVAAENNASMEIVQGNPAGGSALSTVYTGEQYPTLQRVNSLQAVDIAGIKRLIVGTAATQTDWGFSVFDLTQTFNPSTPFDHRMYVRHREEGTAEPWDYPAARHYNRDMAAGGNAVFVDGTDIYASSDTLDMIYKYSVDSIARSDYQFDPVYDAEYYPESQFYADGVPTLFGVTGAVPLLGVLGKPAGSSWFDAAHDSSTAGTSVKLNFPVGITKRDNFLYISDSSNHRIRKYDVTTQQAETLLGSDNTTVFGNILKPPTALEDGKLADSADKGFTDIDHTGGVPADKARLAYPHGVVFDAEGNMLVADTDHRRVRMLKNGKVYTLAGTVAGAPEVNGDSRRAGLGEIWSMALDSEGNLVIADGRSNKLRRLWLNPKSKQN
jgi:DNA-binding beta-propeller fold protein YncE